MAFSTNSGSSQGTSTSSSQSGSQLLPGAMSAYQDLLGRNQTNYRSVLDAYGGGLRNAQTQLPGIYSGYGQLNSNVAKTLGQGGGWGIATPAAQAIQRVFEQTQGANQQQAVSSGLANTSVLQNQQLGAARQAAQAYGGLGAQLAQTYAGYQSQFGLAQLGARQQGLGLQTGLSAQLGNALAGYKFANTFGPLYGQYSNSASNSQNTSANSGSSYSPSGGGSGYGGGSNAGHPDPSQLPINPYGGYGNYLGGSPSNYYGTGGYVGGAGNLNFGAGDGSNVPGLGGFLNSGVGSTGGDDFFSGLGSGDFYY